MNARLAFLAALLWCVAAAAGQRPALPHAHSPALAGESHGWGLAPSLGGWAILHVPPRRAAQGRVGAADGTMAIAGRLGARPEAIAAWDRDLFIVAAPLWTKSRGLRRAVSRMSIMPLPTGGWAYEPVGDLFTAPSLPGDGDLTAVVGSPRGPLVAMRDGEGRHRLWAIEGTEWRDVSPWDRSPAEVCLIAERGGVWAFTPEDAWFATWSEGRMAEHDAMTWGRPVAVPPRTRDVMMVASMSGRFIWADAPEDGVISIDAAGPVGGGPLARVEGMGEQVLIVPMEESSRVVLVAVASELGSSRVVEVSASTGRVLYDGPAEGHGPVTIAEIRMLAMLLFGVTLITLIFIVRSPLGHATLPLAPGLALADPGRRLVAGLVDAAPGVLIGLRLWDIPATWLARPWLLVETVDSAGALASALAIGFALSALLEWRTGATPGKWLVGLRTVAIRHEDGLVACGRPTLVRAVVRNLIRWGVPPVVWVGMLSMGRRHLGDRLAGSAVVTPTHD